MKRPRLALGLAALGLFAATAVVWRVAMKSTSDPDAPCGAGFVRHGARCCVAGGATAALGRCAVRTGLACPAPLEAVGGRGCDAPERDVVFVPPMTITVGPSDWEAEGRVKPRSAEVHAFAIDRFEVTLGHACSSPILGGRADLCADAATDAARAAAGISLAEARSYCRSQGGRLPTEDEWLAAAGGERPRRYPWGDTGAVCRRAAWGLTHGPCGEGASGPDTVGSHPDGATPLGIHDLAGNVAEWVETVESSADAARSEAPGDAAPVADHGRTPQEPAPDHAVVRGGSFKTALATELRTWLRESRFGDVKDATIGFRCAYSAVP